MIVGPDSVLRKVPIALNRKQGYFIEGIRVCIEMIDLAHRRLQEVLLAATSALRDSQSPDASLFVSTMLDAWSIVDSAHRLCDLAQHFPNIRNQRRNPAFRNLFRIGRDVNTLRNTVQHLPGSIHDMREAPQWSVWGALTWCVPYPDDVIHSCQYLCGKVETGTLGELANPIGQAIRLPVGLITLRQDKISVSISELVGITEKFASALEKMLADSFEANTLLKEHYPSDVLIAVAMKSSSEQVAS